MKKCCCFWRLIKRTRFHPNLRHHSALTKHLACIRHLTSISSDLYFVVCRIENELILIFPFFSLSKVGYLFSQQRYRALINVALLELVLGDLNIKHYQCMKSCLWHSLILEPVGECIFINLRSPSELPRPTERMNWSYSFKKYGSKQVFTWLLPTFLKAQQYTNMMFLHKNSFMKRNNIYWELLWPIKNNGNIILPPLQNKTKKKIPSTVLEKTGKT